MKIVNLLADLEGSPGVVQMLWGRRSVGVSEVPRLIERAHSSSRPRVHCFIGKKNVFDSERILDLILQEGFRATFSPAVDSLLDEEEIFHLANFLDVLGMYHEAEEPRRIFYRRWREELATHRRRDPKPDDIVLPESRVPASLRGKVIRRLTFLLPREEDTARTMPRPLSPELSQFFEKRGAQASFGPRRERLEISGWTNTTIYHVPEAEETLLIERASRAARESTPAISLPAKILLCGWYGTETLGDKAILGGVIAAARRRCPGLAVDLASLEPFISETTARQMPELSIGRVLNLAEAFAAVTAREYTAIAIAGGPLMSSIPWCTHLLELFAAAKQAGSTCLVIGCGIGPLSSNHRNAAIRHLLELADDVVLRDEASAEMARTVLGVDRNWRTALDPAFVWIQRMAPADIKRDSRQILLAVRDWPIEEFAAHMDRAVAEKAKAVFETELVTMVRTLLDHDSSVKIVPFCMHKYALGGDDRVFYRRILRDFPEILARLDDRHRAPVQDLRLFARSRAVLAMRFHSVVFSLATRTPFLAVDYTLGGKIAGLLADVGARHLLTPIDQFDGTSTAARLLALVDGSPVGDLTARTTATEAVLASCFSFLAPPTASPSRRPDSSEGEGFMACSRSSRRTE